MSRPIYTASGEVIYGETPEDGIVAKVYGDPELADLMARAANNYGDLLYALKAIDTEGKDANANGDVSIPSEIWDLVQQTLDKAAGP